MANYVNDILQRLLVVLYYIARFFGLITFRINFKDRVLECSKVAKFYSKFISIAIILACTTALIYVLATLSREILDDLTNGVWLSLDCLLNLNAILIMLTVLSKTKEIASVFEKIFATQNDIYKITRNSNVFSKYVLILVALKLVIISLIANRAVTNFEDAKAHNSIQASLIRIVLLYSIYLRYFFVEICFVALMIAIRAQFEQLNLYVTKIYRELNVIDSYRNISIQMCCDCSDEIDKIAAIHWRITKAVNDLITVFQGPLNISIINRMQHVVFVMFEVYLGNGKSTPYNIFLTFIDLMVLILVVEFTKQPSKIPVDFLTTFDIKYGNRLQRSVEMVKFQQALQPFEIKFFNMFELNNEVILALVDAIINYIAILIQFHKVQHTTQ